MTNNLWGSGRQPIKLIGINAPFQPRLQFGREYTSDIDKRTAAFSQWAGDVGNSAFRNHQPPSIKEPAPQREQTILSHRLSPQLQRQLRSGFSAPENNGRAAVNGHPRIEQINAGKVHDVQRGSFHTTTVPTPDGKMSLRVVAGHF